MPHNAFSRSPGASLDAQPAPVDRFGQTYVFCRISHLAEKSLLDVSDRDSLNGQHKFAGMIPMPACRKTGRDSVEHHLRIQDFISLCIGFDSMVFRDVTISAGKRFVRPGTCKNKFHHDPPPVALFSDPTNSTFDEPHTHTPINPYVERSKRREIKSVCFRIDCYLDSTASSAAPRAPTS